MKFRENYAFLSNLFEAPVRYEGLTFRNNEAAFQSAKCTDVEERKQFTSMSGAEVKKAGRKVKLRSDWEQIKVSVMKEICEAKFSQNKDLQKLLIDTGNIELVEDNTWNDTFWGVCNGIGENHLGKILMEVRNKYQVGSITFKQIFEVTKEEAENAEVWLITRSNKAFHADKLGFEVKHVKELAPNNSLFSLYFQLKEQGKWNSHTFQEMYVPEFLEQMHEKTATDALNKLFVESKHKNIICCCFCKNELLCHRSIVAGLMQGVGANVISDKDYTAFYEQYKKVAPKKEEVPAGKIACFTGRRPKDLYGYKREPYSLIVQKTKEVVIDLYNQGYRSFISGGAQGFDQLAFWAVHAAKKSCPDIKNILFVPFAGQESPWLKKGAFSQEDYDKMLDHADDVLYVTGELNRNNYSAVSKAMYDRNHAMVNNSDVVIGLYPDDTWKTATKGGTAECLQYANNKNKKIIQICYDPKDCNKVPIVK